MSSNLSRAINLLQTRIKVEGVSNTSVANHVNLANSGRADAKNCTAVPALDSPMKVTVASALLELARASRNPKDRSVSAIHQWWAFVRYLAFFDQSAGFLTVGAEGRAFINNQRRVASEELGVAFSLLVGRRWMASLHGSYVPSSVTDIELALAGHSQQVAQLPGRTKRPDWLLTVGAPANPMLFANYLLESKGTAADNHANIQLAAAARQLQSVSVGGVVPQGLAVSTVTGKGKVRYVAVDPGQEPEFFEIDPEAIVALVLGEQKTPKSGKVDLDLEYLTSASVYWSLVSIADFARNTEALQRLKMNPRPIEDLLGTAVREYWTDFGPVDGIERTWRLPDGRVSIVVGVESEMNQRLERGDIAGAIERRAEWAASNSPGNNSDVFLDNGQDGHTRSVEGGTRTSATTTSSDGAILSISLVD
ncbi:hypothetical protein [Rhodococcoides fascians]|uniref:hypothetical protein n=1 Tax=Rhodococcoides fascians TaxID=1828 RepID=UPI000A825195|nr:hypothetical protein [Rhodococcus fascians]